MRLKLALSAVVASLLLTAPALAAQEPAPEGKTGCAGKEGRRLSKLERMERRLERAVEKGRLSRAQADQFLAEGRQLHAEALALREAGGGQLTEEQKQQLKQRRQSLREKVRAALRANAPQDV